MRSSEISITFSSAERPDEMQKTTVVQYHSNLKSEQFVPAPISDQSYEDHTAGCFSMFRRCFSGRRRTRRSREPEAPLSYALKMTTFPVGPTNCSSVPGPKRYIPPDHFQPPAVLEERHGIRPFLPANPILEVNYYG